MPVVNNINSASENRNSPLVSIIIPTYNAGDTLIKALESILEQTCPDWEVIFVDGLSCDNTINIIGRYASLNGQIRYISEKDNGIYDAMNKGLSLARGKWIFFLGADDVLENPFVLEKVFKTEGVQDYHVLYGDVRISGDTSWARDQEIYDGVFDFNKLIVKNICHQSVFYRKSFLDTIGYYNTSYKLCADWDFNLRCFAKTKFLYLNQVIAVFYAGGESTAHHRDEAFLKDFLPNVLSYFSLSVFDPIVNTDTFPYYYQILKLQRQHHYFKYLAQQAKKRINLFK